MRTDLNYLKTMSGEDPVLMSEMIEIFRDQVIDLHKEMQDFLNTGDYESLGKVAHKAKTSVAIMGMDKLTAKLKKLELEAKDGKNIESFQHCVDQFKLETEEAVAELDNFKNNLS